MLSDDQVHYLVNTATPQIKALDLRRYPNGDPLVTWGDFDAITRICIRPESLESLVIALFWVDALTERGHPVPELVIPCLPGARQDRMNPQGDYLFTAKSIAKMINERNFPKVITVDPHSEVMPALIERCSVVHSDEIIGPILSDLASDHTGRAVIAPDAGAAKRAAAVAKTFGVPVLQAWKKRSTVDGSISGFGMEPFSALDGDWVLVVDDLCDGGGTFLGLANLFPKAVQADLYVTHGLFTKGVTELFSKYRAIISTDTVIDQPEGVCVIPVAQKLLEKGHL